MKKPSIKTIDKLWGKAVRLRDKNICQSCNRPGNNPHHIFGRRYKSTRHDVENGITLCWACHRHKAHGTVEEFRDFIINRIGEKRFNALKLRAYSIKTYDLEMSKLQLEKFIEMYEKCGIN